MKSFILYLVGIAAQYCTDISVTTFGTPETIEAWASIRSIVGIAGTLCLIGIDYVLIRSPQSSGRLLSALMIQIPALSLLVGALVWALGLMPSMWNAAVVAAGSAILLALSQYFRSHRHNFKSQLIRQAWKIVAALVIGYFLLTGRDVVLDRVVAALLFLASVGSILLVYLYSPSHLHTQDPEPIRSLYSIGSRFTVTSVMLALSVYAEQLVVSKLGTPHAAATYFTHTTFFLAPVAIFNGYLAFLVGPWVRDNHDQFSDTLRLRWIYILLAAAGYSIVLNLVSWIVWEIINPTAGAIDPTLQLIFLIGAFMRTLYTLPSGYNGVFGRPRQHDLLILTQLLSFGIVIVLFYLFRFVGIDLLHAVGLASALNWTLRNIAAFLTMWIIQRSRRLG